MMISEIVHNIPAHKAGCMMDFLQTTDAKSLYDAVISTNPNLSDKRSMVSIRAIQETVSARQMRWAPTALQYADGLTKVCQKLRLTFRRWLQDPISTIVEAKMAKE